MSIRRIAILVSLTATVCAAAVVPARAAKPYRAEHYHTRVVVEPGGSIVVTETIRFIFGPDDFTYVYRELPSRRLDGLTIVEASMDGIPMERGKAAGQFEVKRDDNRRRILWHFPATSDAARTLTVTYRAAGVVWRTPIVTCWPGPCSRRATSMRSIARLARWPIPPPSMM